MKQILTIITIMIISITGYSQINVHNVVPSWAVPYFQANIRIKDSLQSQNIITDSLAIMHGKVIMQNPNDTMLSVRGDAYFQNLLTTENIVVNDSLLYSDIITNITTIDSISGVHATKTIGSMTYHLDSMYANIFYNGFLFDFRDTVNNVLHSDITSQTPIVDSTGLHFRTTGSGFTNGNYYGRIILKAPITDTVITQKKIIVDGIFEVADSVLIVNSSDSTSIFNGKVIIKNSTDAILVVDPTDSTVTQLGMVKRTYVLTVNDDANLVLPDDFAGWVEVSALNSGTEDEYASFRINSDGTIAGLTFNTANVTLVLGIDGNLNIGTTSTKGVIENKLGGSRDFIVRIEGKLYLGM